jgi:hypothetical protein
MRSTHNNKIKILSYLIAVLVLFMQVVPKTEFASAGEHRLPEWNIDHNIALLNVSGNQPTKAAHRQIIELNLSPAHCFFDKYDILSIPELTDSKKIYGGGFSYANMYKTFLTVHYSTCT